MSDSESDGDEYVYFGTALVKENVNVFAHARATPFEGATKSVPVHQQEVRDEQGRQRLHGAFTGGYSAGFYNTVGSAVRPNAPGGRAAAGARTAPSLPVALARRRRVTAP